MSALEVGNRLRASGVRVGNGETRPIRTISHIRKRNPRWGMPPGRRERREKKKKGLNYRELVFLISCLLTCSMRTHDAVGNSMFS